jgi:hypothetical protein
MKKLLPLFLAIIISIHLNAQDKKAASTFAIALNQDNAFGFAPNMSGSLGLNKNLSLTYYGILWTRYNNSLETGIGVGFPALKGKAYINPSLGFTHGSILSGSTQKVIGDGIVPNIVAFYTGNYTEAEVFFSYYKALKGMDTGTSSDFILYWAYPGLRLTENFSAGLHYEQFALIRNDLGESGSEYQWLGAYAKFIAGGKYTFRLSMGTNFTDANHAIYSSNFAKLAVFVPLL